jgi:hypothetical protein
MTKPTEEQVKDITAMTKEIYADMTNALLFSSKKFEGQKEVYVQSALMSSMTRLLLVTGIATGLGYDAIKEGVCTCIDMYKAEAEEEETDIPIPKYMN